MKILMIGQTTADHYQMSIINPHKIMLTIDKQVDHIKITSKVDHILIGKKCEMQVNIKKDGYFQIKNLFL